MGEEIQAGSWQDRKPKGWNKELSWWVRQQKGLKKTEGVSGRLDKKLFQTASKTEKKLKTDEKT